MASPSTHASQQVGPSTTPKKGKLVEVEDVPMPKFVAILYPLQGKLLTLKFLDYNITNEKSFPEL